MKQYKKIQPEVIVGLGEDTEFVENQQQFKTVTKLHINLEDWLGDDLMECYSCYIITEHLKKILEDSSIDGYVINEIKVTLDENFENNYQQKRALPNFYWLQIIGKQNVNDLYLDNEKNLNVTQCFLDLIHSNITLKYLEIEPERNEFDNLLDQMIAESKTSEGSGKADKDDDKDNPWLPKVGDKN